MKNTRGVEKEKPQKKTNLNKKKRKRGVEREKGGNPNAIKSLTMARAEKVFALQERRGEIR